MANNIDHPEHYGGNTTYEAIKVIEAWGPEFQPRQCCQVYLSCREEGA